MKQQHFSNTKGNFLQRRYGVHLGRRYVLAAASVVFFSVFGYPSIENSTNTLSKSRLPGLEESRISENKNQF